MRHEGAPLGGSEGFRASSLDELVSSLETVLRARCVRLPSPDGPVDALGNRFKLPASELWFCSYGTPLTLAFPESDYQRVQFRHAGAGATTVGGERVAVTDAQACLSTGGGVIEFGEGFQQFAWRIERDVLVRRLSALAGQPIVRPLEFGLTLDLATPRARALCQLLACLVGAIDGGGPHLALVLAELEQALIVSLLCTAQHNCRDLLEPVPRSAAPWQVRRVEEYIEANWHEPLDIERLVEVSGASARTIFRAFRQCRGYSPMEFAKRRRLEHAREMLRDGGAAATVTEIAFACGFNDLSHFSKEFLRAWGEPPSALLRRGRDTDQAAA